MQKAKSPAARKMPKTPARKRAMLGAAATTGHVDSPATVVIRKKTAKTPKALPKKGRKSDPKVCSSVCIQFTVTG